MNATMTESTNKRFKIKGQTYKVYIENLEVSGRMTYRGFAVAAAKSIGRHYADFEAPTQSERDAKFAAWIETTGAVEQS
jgi:hypothetical protein